MTLPVPNTYSTVTRTILRQILRYCVVFYIFLCWHLAKSQVTIIIIVAPMWVFAVAAKKTCCSARRKSYSYLMRSLIAARALALWGYVSVKKEPKNEEKEPGSSKPGKIREIQAKKWNLSSRSGWKVFEIRKHFLKREIHLSVSKETDDFG